MRSLIFTTVVKCFARSPDAQVTVEPDVATDGDVGRVTECPHIFKYLVRRGNFLVPEPGAYWSLKSRIVHICIIAGGAICCGPGDSSGCDRPLRSTTARSASR
ncbi:MAG: hypothetical protein IPG06_22970 [Haliea sp.]|nr:hypothetical protein [Haliea sp.]